MTWQAGRFVRLHVFLGVATCLLLSAAVVIRSLPVQSLVETAVEKIEVEKTPFHFPNLALKDLDLVQSGLDLKADFHASAFLMRPNAIVPKRALCLRDLEKQTERDVTEKRPIYLKQEQGRLTFARLGEQTTLWALPERVGDRVSLDIYAHIQGEDHWVKCVEIPFDDAKPWPVKGIDSQGLLIDTRLSDRLGLRWYGRNILNPSEGEKLIFERTGESCYAKQGAWFSLSPRGFGPIEPRGSKYEPVIQLKEVRDNCLEFEVVDADAQCALRFQLQRTSDHLVDTCLQKLLFLGRRQMDSVYLECMGKRFVAPFGSLLFFSEENWSNEEKAGPALRIEKIEQGKLIATLFSAGRSLCQQVTMKPEGL